MTLGQLVMNHRIRSYTGGYEQVTHTFTSTFTLLPSVFQTYNFIALVTKTKVSYQLLQSVRPSTIST